MGKSQKIKNLETGKIYASARAAAAAHGVHYHVVCDVANGRRVVEGLPLAWLHGGGPQKETLCWKCGKLSCSWVKSLTPVEGWKAIPAPALDSYIVVKCPEYVEGRESSPEKTQIVPAPPRKKKGKTYSGTIIGTDIVTGEEIRFPSIRDADDSGYGREKIYLCLTGKKKTYKGYTWRKEK